MGPILIFDKSLLQSLNPDEALWLDQFFLVNITPLFFIETLADLEKEVRRGRTPEQVVGSLAAKTPDLHSRPNVHHAALIAGELSGVASIEIGTGRPIVSGGKYTELGGKSGVFFEPAPEEDAFRRWQRGEFLDLERQRAKRWRAGLSLISPERQREIFSQWLGEHPPKTLSDVKVLADRVIDGPDRESSLGLGLQLVGLLPEAQVRVIDRWRATGRPALARFAPYFRHVYGVELFFYLGLATRLISDRRTNKVDIAYLYYLPFCMVFTSSDKLHADTAPLFARPNQSFIAGPDLKAALAALDRHYDALPSAVKLRGLYHFASQPPDQTSFLVTRLWDIHMSPTWRDASRRPDQPRDEKREAAIVDYLRHEVEAARSEPAAPPRDSDDVDSVIITRHVAMRRGKWNRFPPEVKPDSG